jgi:hypothetical protein
MPPTARLKTQLTSMARFGGGHDDDYDEPQLEHAVTSDHLMALRQRRRPMQAQERRLSAIRPRNWTSTPMRLSMLATMLTRNC